MKSVTVNGRTFYVPQPRDSQQKRDTLRQLQHHVENLNHDDGFIEQSDWEGIGEALEILRKIDHARRDREGKADSDIYTAMVEMRELLKSIRNGSFIPTNERLDAVIEQANQAETGAEQ